MSSVPSRSDSITIASSPELEPRCRGVYISPASLNLERVYEQNRQRQQKKDGGKAPELSAAEQTKGKPRLLLMGQRRYAQTTFISLLCALLATDGQPRSGKSSISSVVFHKLPPTETLFLESTARIQKDSLKYRCPPWETNPLSITAQALFC